jgi:2-dehydro-3-deoxygluconokinase
MIFNPSKTGKVLTFGELLLRLSLSANGNWLKNSELPVYVGGAELNVATALSLWGIDTGYFTALPNNNLSDQLIDYLSDKGIDTSAIYRCGSRVGLFYLTTGADMKNEAVIYDRAGSAFTELQPGMIDWGKVLDGVSWFHFSAICPAISQQTADLCEEVLMAAAERNITISIDLNYRAKLWQYGEPPPSVMTPLVKYCSVIMGNIWAAESLLGIPVKSDIHEAGTKRAYVEEALTCSQKIVELFPNCVAVANTFRFNHNGGIKYYTTLYQNGELHLSGEYISDHIVDKVGSGDCFMAGLIYGYYKGMEPREIVNFAAAAAYMKLFVAGDATQTTVAQITEAIKYDN